MHLFSQLDKFLHLQTQHDPPTRPIASHNDRHVLTMYTNPTRKRHRSISSSSSPDSPPTLPSSTDPTRPSSRSVSPQPDSDFESLPAHLVNGAPRRKRRRKSAYGVAGGEGRREGRAEPFIRTGFEDMVLESDGEDVYTTVQEVPSNGYPVHGQQEELVDSPPTTSRNYFTFPQNINPAFYDTYRTRDAAEPDTQGDTLVMNDADVVQPQSVETPEGEVPPQRWRMGKEPWRTAGDPMVEDVSDPEAGGKSRFTNRGKTWYEPEKDRELSPQGSVMIDADKGTGIIVTSLSDTESEPTSPEPTTPPIDLSSTTDEIIELPPADRLTQPGSRGFTIHPTLLNRLNRMSGGADQGSRMPFRKVPDYGQTQERGLILYRTPGRTFNGVGRRPGGMESDDEEDTADRFQLLPDDQDGEMMAVEPDDGVAGMEDVEVDQSGIMEDVDSMEIG